MEKTGTLILLLCLSLSWFSNPAAAWGSKEKQKVQVASPYIDLHTGPGKGYPKFYVAPRGEWIELLKRKTGWFKVRTLNGKEGWVYEKQLEHTLTPAGDVFAIEGETVVDFQKRKWELGFGGGDFGGADVISAYAGYNFTKNIAAEVTVSQALGTFSDTMFADFSLVHQAFPEWRISPFFALGGGVIKTDPKSTLVSTEDRQDNSLHVGGGMRLYLSKRFVLRLEYKNYVVLTSRDDDEEIEQWKLGFSAFF
ncbi:MAG: SH3 domain-containing protein [Pseudomonadales bacterium]